MCLLATHVNLSPLPPTGSSFVCPGRVALRGTCHPVPSGGRAKGLEVPVGKPGPGWGCCGHTEPEAQRRGYAGGRFSSCLR